MRWDFLKVNTVFGRLYAVCAVGCSPEDLDLFAVRGWRLVAVSNGLCYFARVPVAKAIGVMSGDELLSQFSLGNVDSQFI